MRLPMHDDSLDREEDEELGPAEIQPVEARWPLHIVKAERTIFELHRLWRRGHLRLDPDFQREFVWSDEKQIKLVESVMARIPLPVFYLSDESEDESLVVDGQQRLSSLFSFMEGRFAEFRGEGAAVLRREQAPASGRPFVLRDLRLLKEYEGKSFETFDAKSQRRFEETPLTCFIIQSGTAPTVKFELFERINEGAHKLMPQEIRNAIYRGPGLELIKRLTPRFREVAGEQRRLGQQMRGNELVLRAVSFMWRGVSEYRGDLKQFLNESLRRLNESTPATRSDLEARFLRAVDLTQQVFGEHAWVAFRSGVWNKHLSGPLVEAVTVGLDRVFGEKQPSRGQCEALVAGFKELCGDSRFDQAILSATQTRKNVELRLQRFEEIARHAREHLS